jgi:hypothetical protein
MNKNFTHVFASIAFCLLCSMAQAQEKTPTESTTKAQSLIISFVAADASFPDLGNIVPDKTQLDNYSKKTGEWIAAHEPEFKQLVVSCGACKRISTWDIAQYGEAGIIRLKEIINAWGPALLMQMKGHESYYPEMIPERVPKGEMTFVVSPADFAMIHTQLSQAK